jgi:REP element-mobilizing transposase RayT
MRGAGANSNLDRVQHELRASGIKPETANPLRSGIHTRGYLPHVKREGAVYFVTFRLADSLPKEVLLRILGQKAARLRRLERQLFSPQPKPSSETQESIERDSIRQVERYLDKGTGACELRRPDLAELVAGAIRFFVDQRYRLDAWVVMPNHVHAVFWPIPNHTVSEILKSWKQYTATRANRILNRVGTDFWQPESFDHWIRNDAEHDRCCRYVVHNPVTAGLCKTPGDWRWSSAWSGQPRNP